MIRGEGACLVCGKPLVYTETARELRCVFCHKPAAAYASCVDGHYVCDQCHEEKGVQTILDYCLSSPLTDPIRIMTQLMEAPYLYMHGPEHHILVGAALLTAYHNSGGQLDLPAALAEMAARGRQVPGGSCGLWGCCGAAVSAGMFVSIATGATPLSEEPWRLANQMTGQALAAIGGLGGPRCCKRNSFTAVLEAVPFAAGHLSVQMSLPKRVVCSFSRENAQCLHTRCPYYPLRPE
ncbi:MAG TPA: SAM-dependent methyltransferase [Firmicutes bacterium]|nr:SAM-dependent methyltransferase [Bacillota bacterium]